MRERITPSESIELPRNPDIERMTLGALLLSESPERILSVRAELPDDAFMGQMRDVYRTLGDMAQGGDSINPVMLACRLTELGSKVDAATIASLTDDAPIRSDLTAEIGKLRDLATRRAVMRETHDLFMAAQGRDADASALVGRLQRVAADLGAVASKRGAVALSVSWADFDAEEFPQGERIAFAVERGELALLNALPNAGKTTLALNVALCLAAGREFLPLVTGRTPRRVLFVDGETTRRRLQRDLRVMTRGFSREEAMAVGENLHVICEGEIKGEPLALTNAAHLLALSAEALSIRPDFIVIDTLASLCPLYSENDNGEQGRKIWRPLQKLARDCDAALLINHHVGKKGSEEGQTPERVYRGRGASASGGAARAVWLLIPDASAPGVVKLACVKAKGETPADVTLQHNPQTRWLDSCQAAPPPLTSYQRVVNAFNGKPLGITDVMALLPDMSKSAIERALKSAVEKGDLDNPKRGKYQKPVSVNSVNTYRGEGNDGNSEPADGIEDSLNFEDFDEQDAGSSDFGFDADEERYLRALDD